MICELVLGACFVVGTGLGSTWFCWYEEIGYWPAVVITAVETVLVALWLVTIGATP